MAEINKENLENALNKEIPKISKEEEIGFHKGTVNTLVNERNELIKMIGNVDALVQMHLTRLQELGVKISEEKR
jgi:hypothetical protein